MSELILELYSEEIPTSLQPIARENIKSLMLEMFVEQNLLAKSVVEKNIDKFLVFSSPCRITFVTNILPSTIIKQASQIKGPKTDAPAQAIQGFLKSYNLKSVEDLQIQNTEKGNYYFYPIKSEEKKTSDILSHNLPKLLQKMSSLWPKTMRWGEGNSNIKWIRPLKNILCVFDGLVVPFEFYGLHSNNKTFGHKHLTNCKPLEVKFFSDYSHKVKENFVIFDHNERAKIITEGIAKISRELENVNVLNNDLDLNQNTSILNTAIGLTEYPVVLYGNIEKHFLELPKEVIINTIKTHLKYFCLQDAYGKLAPFFIFISNIKSNKTEEIIKNNEKVLKARLNDAEFYILEDLKIPLIERLEMLKGIIFHEKIGSLYDKTMRTIELAKFISLWVPHTNLVLMEKACELSKIDLTTNAVSEMPELQGTIGNYYADKQGEDKQIGTAIEEHYLPKGKDDILPNSPIGITLALADKIDTLAALFIAGEKPTSSKDPFALRRATIGIIRIILEYQINLPLNLVISKSLNSFIIKIYKNTKLDNENIKKQKLRFKKELLAFISERFKTYLKEKGYRHDIIDCVLLREEKLDKSFLLKKNIFSLFNLYQRIDEIDKFLKHEHSWPVLNIYKRINNILHENKSLLNKKILYISNLELPEEESLYKTIKHLENIADKLLKENNYITVLEEIYKIKQVVEVFFDKVLINVGNNKQRNNRVLLLLKLKGIFDKIAEFSKVEG